MSLSPNAKTTTTTHKKKTFHKIKIHKLPYKFTPKTIYVLFQKVSSACRNTKAHRDRADSILPVHTCLCGIKPRASTDVQRVVNLVENRWLYSYILFQPSGAFSPIITHRPKKDRSKSIAEYWTVDKAEMGNLPLTFYVLLKKQRQHSQSVHQCHGMRQMQSLSDGWRVSDTSAWNRFYCLGLWSGVKL